MPREKTEEVLTEKVSRAECLDTAKTFVCQDRDQQYGQPEDSFALIAKFWTTWLGVKVTPHDVAIMMGFLKAARIKKGKYKPDNYEDFAGYIACACEIGE